MPLATLLSLDLDPCAKLIMMKWKFSFQIKVTFCLFICLFISNDPLLTFSGTFGRFFDAWAVDESPLPAADVLAAAAAACCLASRGSSGTCFEPRLPCRFQSSSSSRFSSGMCRVFPITAADDDEGADLPM